ncbi:MAG: hypothetical protein SGJ19_01180 [Planctomycetia bacterium]|nr:hypothetical protein [Planctomycetia bacterium]
MADESDSEKVARFQAALDQLIDRLAEDRYVLAAVLVGSLSADTIWRRDRSVSGSLRLTASRAACAATATTNGFFVSLSRTASTFMPK